MKLKAGETVGDNIRLYVVGRDQKLHKIDLTPRSHIDHRVTYDELNTMLKILSLS